MSPGLLSFLCLGRQSDPFRFTKATRSSMVERPDGSGEVAGSSPAVSISLTGNGVLTPPNHKSGAAFRDGEIETLHP